MQPVQSRKFSKTPLLLFVFGLIVGLAGCTQPLPPKADVVVAEPEEPPPPPPSPKAVVVVAAPPEEPSSVWLELTTKMKFRRIPGGELPDGQSDHRGRP